MTKCKWCEKELEYSDTIFCYNDCKRMYYLYEVRKSVWEFSTEIEKVMQEKDKLGYADKDKSLEFLVNKLREERAEVDYELISNLPLGNINEELLHEAIMTMLVRQRIIDYGKHAKTN